MSNRFKGTIKGIRRVRDIQETLEVRTAELRAEREDKKALVEKLTIANTQNAQLETRVAELEAQLAGEQRATFERLHQEITALKRGVAFWHPALSSEDEAENTIIRLQLESLFEWQLSTHRKIADYNLLITGRHALIADLQSLERKASLEGNEEGYAQFRARSDEAYAEIKMYREEIGKLRAIVSTKIVPMIDKVMGGEYRQADEHEEVLKEKTPSVEKIAAAVGQNRGVVRVQDSEMSDDPGLEVYHPTIPTRQPLTALDRYELSLVFANVKVVRDIVEIIRWLMAEDFAKRLSQFAILIEEDAFEARLEKTARLKWDFNGKQDIAKRMRARKIVKLLLEHLPIWTSNELPSRLIELRIDREGKLQQFLQVLDFRFRQRIAQRERMQNAQTQKQKPSKHSPKPLLSKEATGSAKERAPLNQLPQSLIGKEQDLLEHVPPGLYLESSDSKSKSIGSIYGKLLSNGLIDSLEQVLRDVGRGIFVQGVIDRWRSTSKSRISLGATESIAQQIVANAQSLSIYNEQGEFNRDAALARAHAILITVRGKNALCTRQRASKHQSATPVHS